MSRPAPARFVGTILAHLGAAGSLALALIAGSAAFHLWQVAPLEARAARLDARASAHASAQGAERSRDRRPGAPAASGDTSKGAYVATGLEGVPVTPQAKLAAFHAFFERQESTTDWLARLHAIAEKVGLEIASADYSVSPAGSRLERYQVMMPLKGNSAQVRAFVENCLIEMPVAAVDRVSFSRKRASDTVIEAHVALSLYRVRQ